MKLLGLWSVDGVSDNSSGKARMDYNWLGPDRLMMLRLVKVYLMSSMPA